MVGYSILPEGVGPPVKCLGRRRPGLRKTKQIWGAELRANSAGIPAHAQGFWSIFERRLRSNQSERMCIGWKAKPGADRDVSTPGFYLLGCPARRSAMQPGGTVVSFELRAKVIVLSSDCHSIVIFNYLLFE